LVEKGADVNAANKNGVTPLMTVSLKGYNEIGRFLVEKGADVNRQMPTGETALMTACIVGNMQLARFLLEKGADKKAKCVDPRKYGYTAAVFAQQGGHLELARLVS